MRQFSYGQYALILTLGAMLHVQPARALQTATPLDVPRVRALIQKKMSEERIPSIAVAVARHGKIVWEEAFGFRDRDKQILATVNTPYYVASVSKSITSTAMMVLVAGKQLNLDAPVNDYLGPKKIHSPVWDASTATVRRVATHTAGLTTYHRKCEVDDSTCKVSIETAIERYGILFWPPGDHFDYSNLGYGILGDLIGRVSGQTFGTFLRQRIFIPLGMADSFLNGPSELEKLAAVQYDSASHVRSPLQLSDTPGASSIHCSVHDLVNFGSFVLKAHVPGQQRILSDSDIDLILNATVTAGENQLYALGWWVQPKFNGYTGIMAQGGTNDSFAILQLIPSEQIAIAVLSNTGTTVPSTIVEEVLSDLLPHFSEARRRSHQQSNSVQSSCSPSLTGEWMGSVTTWKGTVPLKVKIFSEGRIQAQIASQPAVSLSDVQIKDSYFYGVARGDLGTPDAAQPPYDIQIEVYLRNNKLLGAATAVPRPDEDGPELPYWVSLSRPH